MATNVYFGVCPNVPADFKTGSPTITISSGVATFSEAQTDSIMGIGAVIDYDTDNKNTYISGKISTSQWSVINADGTTPGDVTGKTVNSITHPFTSISSAEAGVGTLMGGTNLNTLDLILNLPQYCEQTSYTRDAANVSFTNLESDVDNPINIFSPGNTTAQCNLNMKPENGFDSTKPAISPPSGNIITMTSSNSTYINLFNYQIEQQSSTAVLNIQRGNNILNIDRCAVHAMGQFVYSTLGSIIKLNNSIFYNSESGRYFMRIQRDSSVYTYSNIIVDFGKLYSLDSYEVYISTRNNIILGLTLNNGGGYKVDVQDNNLWRGAINPANGLTIPYTDIETTATDAELFRSATGSYEDYDWRPLGVQSDQVDTGYDLNTDSNANNNDFNNDNIRPLGKGWDIGAFEYPQRVTSAMWFGTQF